MAKLKGIYKRLRFDRDSGMYLGLDCGENTIQSAGIDNILDLGIGNAGTVANQSNSVLDLTLTSGSTSTFDTSADSAPSGDSGNNEITWQWSDETADEYTIDTLDFYLGSTGGTLFSTVSCPFSNCSKPSTENWIYQYSLSISANDAPLTDAGVYEWLKIFAGLESNDWTVNSGPALEVDDDGGNTPTLTPPDVQTRPDNTTVHWEWEADGSTANQEWLIITIGKHDTGSITTTLRSENESLGTKESGAVWTYEYDFNLS